MCEELPNDPETTNHQEILLEQYKITINFLQFEATTLWQIFNTFFIGNSIFLGVAFSMLENDYVNHPLYLAIGIVGLLVSALWFGTFRRNSHWYSFRMKQAKKAEKRYLKSISDKKWYLLNKKASSFANGDEIKGLKNNHSGYGMIILYMSIYLGFIVWASFNLICRA